MKIVLVRHGQTEWNKEKRVQGRTDTQLNTMGLYQARAIGERLTPMKLAAIYTSPLKRAYETASEIASHQSCDVKVMPELTEINFGAWEGKTDDDLRRDYAKFWNDWNWIENTELCRELGSETGADIEKRAMKAFNEIVAAHDRRDCVAIVSHTMPIKMIIANCIGLPIARIRRLKLDNCGYNEIIIEDGAASLVTLNEVAHLVERRLK